MKKLNVFDPNDLKEFEPDAKVGLIATVSEGELPHITLITALQARSTTELIWGQFSEGMSKRNVRKNPRVGFLIMSLSKELWRGKAVWKKALNEGDEYIMFNKKPMWRYNSYFGLHTVHYMDLVETTGREKLPMGGIVRGALMTKCAKAGASSGEQARILKPFAEDLFNDIGALKFISYIGSDGYPVIIPAIQCQAADSRRLAFAPTAYREELAAIPAGTTVAPEPVAAVEAKPAPAPAPAPAEAKPATPAPAPVEAKPAATPAPAPTAPKPATPAAKTPGVNYKIRWGDTLWDLAYAYYRNPWLYPKIAAANSIKNPDLIISGTTIWIPAK